MTLLTKDRDEKVMSYGDEGDLFYFMLSGEVEISIPMPDRRKKFDERFKQLEQLEARR